MDETVLLWINQGWAHPWLDSFFWWVSQRASFAFPLAGLLLLFLVRRFRQDGVKLWLLLALTVGAGDALGNLLKHITDQPRPCYAVADLVRQPGQAPGTPCGGDLYGMPSNHALNFFAAAAFLSLVMRSRAWLAGAFTVALLVGISRIYLAKHYPSQVLAGATIGAALGYIGAWIGVNYFPFMQRIKRKAHLPHDSH
ncbi:MAG: phosphatase PAP2 family protein [Gammaproteobacteria bacterium]|nr:phosphatase PAP2 family protein [Gammaproteobacteria bacterium]